jgi:hypothetical protein
MQKMAFLTRNRAKLCKFFIITLDFEKNGNFFAENWQKSQKIVFITSTPGLLYLSSIICISNQALTSPSAQPQSSSEMFTVQLYIPSSKQPIAVPQQGCQIFKASIYQNRGKMYPKNAKFALRRRFP